MDKNTEQMLAGHYYRPDRPELQNWTHKAHRLCQEYNRLLDTDRDRRQKILDQLFPDHEINVYLQGPIQVDYGRFTHLGKNFYANFNFTVLDTCPVHIGDNVKCGPNVTLVTPLHPLLTEQRNLRRQKDGIVSDFEYGAPITIGANCWLASNVTVCPGVTIGHDSVIGAGSVVTHSMPANSLIAGVPAKVIRKLTDKDRLPDFPY